MSFWRLISNRYSLQLARILRRAIKIAAVALVISAVVVGLKVSGGLAYLTRPLAEARFSFLHSAPTGDIVFVEIDARSLQEAGIWPWPRRLYAEALDKLREMGASDIVFDIDFSSKSSSANDLIFSQALERAGGSVGLATFQQPASSGNARGKQALVNRPIETLRRVSWPVVVSVPIAEDGRVWQAIWGDEISEEPTLSLAAFLGGGEAAMGQAFYIDYSIDPTSLPIFSFIDLINGHVAPAAIQGRKVVIGASAQELRDLFSVPVHGVLPGAVVQILAAESILQQRALTIQGWLECLIAALLFALPLVIWKRFDWWWRASGILGGMALFEALGLVVQSKYPVMLETSGAQIALTLVFLHLLFRQIGLGKILLRISRVQTHNANNILGRVFDDSFDGIMVIDQKLRIQAMSRAAYRILPSSVSVGVRADNVLPDELMGAVREVFDSQFNWSRNAADIREVIIPLEEGDQRVVEFVVAASTHLDLGRSKKASQEVCLASVTCRDVTAQREATNKLQHMARHDAITGLLNRSGLENCPLATGHGLPNGMKLCLALTAVDQLDQLVASLGFQYGDLLAQATADRMRGMAIQGTTLSAIGGDRLALLFPVSSDVEARSFLEQMKSAISGEYDLAGNRVIVRFDMGYSIRQYEAGSIQELLREAGNALALAHGHSERGPVKYREKMSNTLRRRRQLDMEMATALEHNEIQAVYQPLVSLKDGELIGVETLMRWTHKDLGSISPVEFIAISEQNGRIKTLGEFILREAMQQAVQWTKPLRVAVNVSPVQFSDSDFINVVKRALNDTGFKPEYLDLELTESLFVEDHSEVEENIRELRKLGCCLSLDDFGTGYSSLGYIPRIPFSKIKIDKCFVDDIHTDAAHRAIVETVVGLARGFGMKVVAEGIEEAVQGEVLRKLGCDIGQGYLYGRPMLGDDIEELLRSAA
ncbi:EAL domain-containing protein [Roseibium sp. CAU 1637]|uniref:EAL domain-containing protein n=1 Tax=Roseibium limicola TaxID=2816037 RepID=A0A939EP87_9HYPH|nr:EAL domain-containing protein [Roseibium limicola]MBO0346077.1 EAL domain-containing protein [Roseibium limicola]